MDIHKPVRHPRAKGILDSRLRREAENICRLYRVILIFTGGLDRTARMKVDEVVANTPNLPRKQLQQHLRFYKDEVHHLKSKFGLRASLKQLEDLIAETEEGSYWFFSKIFIGTLFERYDRALPIYPKLPPHADIAVDIHGLSNNLGRIDIFLLEASLFEDMAALWNEAVDGERIHVTDESEAIIHRKRTAALLRSTAKAVFNLLEGYLNGLAADILISDHPTGEDKERLTEWNEQKKRYRLLSLRDKLLQYPRIAIGSQHPPLQESSCSYMAYILEEEERLRHALIHPTPLQKVVDHDPNHTRETRKEAYAQLTSEKLSKLIDCTIDMISTIDMTIGKKFGDINFWLQQRDKDTGRFHDTVFS